MECTWASLEWWAGVGDQFHHTPVKDCDYLLMLLGIDFETIELIATGDMLAPLGVLFCMSVVVSTPEMSPSLLTVAAGAERD